MNAPAETVVVLGASRKPERYSFQAVELLLQHGHKVIPVNPSGGRVLGLDIVASLDDIEDPVDTLTVYLNPSVSQELTHAIVQLHPNRVIFNPGTENDQLQQACAESGIQTENACTLVLLKTGAW